MMFGVVLLASLLAPGLSSPDCDCDILSLSPLAGRRLSTSDLGLYNKVLGVEVGGRAVWLHQNENYFLYYSNQSSMWGVGQVLGGEEAQLENRGSVEMCPGDLGTTWLRRADLEAEERLEVVCLRGPCAGYTCGPNAECDERTESCRCRESYSGDPHERCFPTVGNLVSSINSNCLTLPCFRESVQLQGDSSHYN